VPALFGVFPGGFGAMRRDAQRNEVARVIGAALNALG
jgi:hypothetical protein